MISHSALLTRLGRFVHLESCEADFILSLEQSNKQCMKGHRLINIGEKTDKVWVLKSGWAVLKSHTRQHGSQVLRIYLPGEFVGLSEFGTNHAPHQIIMQTDGVVSEICRKALHRDMAEYPRLSSLLSAIGNLSLTAFHYQVSRLNTLSAQNNLKFFLLQLQSRLHAGQTQLGNRFEVPMSQVEIGQILGITSIYVNKLLRNFVADGQLEIERPYFRLKARKLWENETSFIDAFDDIDTSWFSAEVARSGRRLPGSLPQQLQSYHSTRDKIAATHRSIAGLA